MLLGYEILYHPTYPVEHYPSFVKSEALLLGSRLLKENRMAHMEAYEEDTYETTDYFICSYRNASDPNLHYGGGAVLVVRKRDRLCGMVHCRSNWLDPDEYDMIAQINNAFQKFDESLS